MGKQKRLVPIIVAVLASTFLVSSCSSESPTATKQSPSPSVSTPSTDTPRFEIPEGFPSDIPIHEGEIVLGSEAGEGTSKTWAIEVLIDDLELGRKQALSELKAAGFMLVKESGIGTDEYLATLTRSDYTIMFKVYFETETSELEIRYVVTGA